MLLKTTKNIFYLSIQIKNYTYHPFQIFTSGVFYIVISFLLQFYQIFSLTTKYVRVICTIKSLRPAFSCWPYSAVLNVDFIIVDKSFFSHCVNYSFTFSSVPKHKKTCRHTTDKHRQRKCDIWDK